MSTTQLVVFVAAAAFVLAAILVRWKQSAVGRSSWMSWLLGVVGVGCFGLGLVVDDFGVVHDHKPVNVSNINVLEDPSDDLFVAGDSLTYFSAKAVTPGLGEYRIFKYDHKQKSVAAIGSRLNALAHSIAVIPKAGMTPEALLLAAGAEVYYGNTKYEQCKPATGTNPVVTVHALRADEGGNLMLGQRAEGTIALYTTQTSLAPFSYSMVADSTITGRGVHSMALSSTGFRRAAFIVEVKPKNQLYTWSGSGTPVVVNDLNPIMMNSGIKLLATKDTSPYVVEVVSAGVCVGVSPADGPGIQDAYGIATWCGFDWVLAKFNDATTLWRVVGNNLVFDEKLGDLVSENLRPRGFVPLGASLGLIAGKSVFWSIVPGRASYKAESIYLNKNYVVRTMWPCHGEALFAADGEDLHGNQIGIAPWRWWTHH
ncbi:MAG: hypothetical protein ACI85K_002959 [Hyphomicrobiaceae bacterium]|jgi:hypothetical protein